MSTISLWRLFHRLPSRTAARNTPADHTGALAVIAFAVATTIFLTVLGGLHGFIWRASPDHTVACLLDADHCDPGALAAHQTALATATATSEPDVSSFYVILALFACLLLLVPFAALAGSAARLAASRRDERLAALRLVGATTSQVVRLTAFDSALQALAGALIGVAGYFAVMPLIMLLNFQNQRFTFAQLWVGPIALAVAVVGVTALALVSALLTLRRVAITPLGVSARQSAPQPGKWRLILFLIAFVLSIALLFNMGLFADAGSAVVLAIVFGVIVGCFALVNLVGSFAVTIRARWRARRPKSAATMIAMRRILDNPKRAWRNVSGIGLAMFIAGSTSACGLFATADGADATSPMAVLMRDISTGGLLTLAFAGVLAAVSSGVTQSASVYDQADEYRMLVLEGTDETTLRKARFQEVMTPLNTIVVLVCVVSIGQLFALLGTSLMEPAPMLTFVGGVALCYALVAVGAFTANRTAARLAATASRADD